jgi:hypothetical protein
METKIISHSNIIHVSQHLNILGVPPHVVCDFKRRNPSVSEMLTIPVAAGRLPHARFFDINGLPNKV